MISMTKQDALKALEDGLKITHRYFSNDEYIKKEDNDFYKDEQNCYLPINEFWNMRQGKNWDDGYSIFSGE